MLVKYKKFFFTYIKTFSLYFTFVTFCVNYVTEGEIYTAFRRVKNRRIRLPQFNVEMFNIS